MQLILAALAAALCIALGMMAANRLSERERLLNAWEDMLQRLEIRVNGSGDALPRMLEDCARGTGLCLEKAAARWAENPALSPEEWMENISWEPLLTPAEKETLKDCLRGLILPHREQQLQALSFAREQWARFRRISREAWENNARLYSSLGWLAGAAVFILIC